MNRVKFVTLAWAAVSLAAVTAAIATPASGTITRNELAVGKVTDPIDIQRTEPTDFHIDVVTIDPGGNSGWHTHPGPEYSVVKAGEIILERAPNCDPITLKAGQGFFTSGGTAHMAHNDGKEPAEIYVTYTVPAGTTVLRQDADEQCGAKTEPPEDTEPPKDTEPPENK
jgi:quercetin dioxygenase-like cupin family protein